MTPEEFLHREIEIIDTTYPQLPRGFLSTAEFQRGMFGTKNGPDYRLWARVKILIESYAFLRVKGFPQDAAYIAVFKRGVVGPESHLDLMEAQKIEKTCEYMKYRMAEICEMTLFEPQDLVEHMKRIDRMAETMRTKKGRKELAKQRQIVLNYITNLYQPKE